MDLKHDGVEDESPFIYGDVCCPRQFFFGGVYLKTHWIHHWKEDENQQKHETQLSSLPPQYKRLPFYSYSCFSYRLWKHRNQSMVCL